MKISTMDHEVEAPFIKKEIKFGRCERGDMREGT